MARALRIQLIPFKIKPSLLYLLVLATAVLTEGSDSADKEAERLINEAFHCKTCGGASQESTNRGSALLVQDIRAPMREWKSEMMSKYPDSLLRGRASLRVLILPDGTVKSSSLAASYSLSDEMADEVLTFSRKLRFRAIQAAVIDTAIFPIRLESLRSDYRFPE